MRIINQEVTGIDLDIAANDYFVNISPKRSGKNIYKANYIGGKLAKLADPSKKTNKYYKVFKYLYDNIEILIKGTPAELIKFDVDFKNYLSAEGISNYLDTPYCKNILNGIFIKAYGTFRSGGYDNYRIKWFDNINLKTCPYCNRNWITKTLNKDNIKFKLYFDIDHFFPKGKSPWFAASFYNLIPSCTICNQRIKHSDELDSDNYLHPYKDDLDAILKFEVPANSADVFLSKTFKIQLNIVPRSPRLLTDIEFIKAKNTFNFFNLKNLYDTHLDYVRELIQKDLIYSPAYISQLYNDYGPTSTDKIFESRDDLMKMLIGNYVLPEQIHERPLAKLTRDLLEDFSINKHI